MSEPTIETLQRYLPDGLEATGQYASAVIDIAHTHTPDLRAAAIEKTSRRVAAVIDGAVTIVTGPPSDFADVVADDFSPSIDVLVLGIGHRKAGASS